MPFNAVAHTQVKMSRQYFSQDNVNEPVEAEERAKGHKYGKQLVRRWPLTTQNHTSTLTQWHPLATQVAVSAADEAAMKFTAEKGLQVIGFTDAASIPRRNNSATTDASLATPLTPLLSAVNQTGEHLLSGVDCITAPPGDVNAESGLSAVIHALAESKRVAIVRFVKRKNAAPLLGVLTPCMVAKRVCLGTGVD